jgi:hypothetical protein
MRVGQLARKLGVSPSQVVTYLASQAEVVDNHPNTRLSDEQTLRVARHFAPDKVETILALPEEPATTEVPIAAAPPEEVIEPAAPVEEPAAATSPEEEASPASVPEVIKAPKIELSGLKVLGKIDLPEPKKKDPPAEAPTELPKGERPAERRPAPRGRETRPPRDQRPRKNPVALQREREAEEARRKREEELKRKKEQKAQHYYKKVKPAAPTRKAKLIHEETEDLPFEQEQPKTWWGRFIKWLNT